MTTTRAIQAAAATRAGIGRREALSSIALVALAAPTLALPLIAQHAKQPVGGRIKQPIQPGQAAQPGEVHSHLIPRTFKVSLCEWSLHRAILGGTLDHLDFAKTAQEKFGIEAVEYVNTFFKDKGADAGYLDEMLKRSEDIGVRNVHLLCDGEGKLCDPSETLRIAAVENHYVWIDAAKTLRCRAIRVFLAGAGTREEQSDRAVQSLKKLAEFAAEREVGVLVENHGGLSSNAAWLAGVLNNVGGTSVGVLISCGSFRIDEANEYDRYKGIEELMPWARGVSAGTQDFNDAGDESTIDYRRALKTVSSAGYRGYVSVNYSGDRLSEPDGIVATRKMLEKYR